MIDFIQKTGAVVYFVVLVVLIFTMLMAWYGFECLSKILRGIRNDRRKNKGKISNTGKA